MSVTKVKGQLPGMVLPTIEEKHSQLIKTVARQALIELGTTLLYTTVTACFIVTPPAIAMLYTNMMILWLFGTIFKCIKARLEYHDYCMNRENSPTLIYFDMCSAALFGLIDLYTRNILLHELGHALAGCLFFSHPQIKITIKVNGTGNTHWPPALYNRLGRFLGRTATSVGIAAAGTVVTLGAAVVALKISRKVRQSYPQLSRSLIAIAIISVADSVWYALSACWKQARPSHDFVQLRNLTGLHPLCFVVAILAIPTVFWIYDQKSLSCAPAHS